MSATGGYESLQSVTLTLTIEDRRSGVRSGELRSKEKASIEVTFGNVIGRGSTCVVYQAYYQQNNSKDNCIVKEWYPQGIKVSRSIKDGKVFYSAGDDEKEYNRRKTQFNDSIDNYYTVAGIDELKDTIPELKYVGRNGQGIFQIFDYNIGQSLDKIEWRRESHHSCLKLFECLTRSLGYWHDHNVMLLDLAPENIFWTKEYNLIRFIDFDSLLVRRDGKWQTPKEQKVRYNDKYLPLNLYQILYDDRGNELFDSNREAMFKNQIKESVNYYFVGCFLFMKVFDSEEMPSVNEEIDVALEEKISNLTEMYPVVFKAKKGDEVRILLKRTLSLLLKSSMGSGYRKTDNIICDLQKLSKCIDECFFEREMQRYRNDILAADILERFPAYRYCSFIGQKEYYYYNSIGGYDTGNGQFIISDNVKRKIDILIVGSHPFRLSLLRYILSCLQMENTEIVIHLAAWNIKSEWNILIGKSPEKVGVEALLSETWPLLGKCVSWRYAGKGEKVFDGEKIVSDKLASVILYETEDSETIKQIIKNYNVRYAFLLGEEEQQRDLVDCFENRHGMVFIEEHEEGSEFHKKPGVEVLSRRTSFKRLNEELRSHHIYEKGFLVHKEYELGVNPGADRESIRRNYDEKKYNQLNSIRAALHANYKLASCGIDPDNKNAAWEYFEKVLASKDHEGYGDLFHRQVALEHRSWTGYQITTGGDRPTDVFDLNRYAFVNNNLWKDKTDEKHIKHLCISASGPKRTLRNEAIWNRFDEECGNDINEVESLLDTYAVQYNLDELDKASLRLYFVIEQRKKQNTVKIEQQLRKLARLSQNASNLVMYPSISALTEIWDQLKVNVQSAAAKWKYVWNDLIYIVENDKEQLESYKEVNNAMSELGTAIAPYIELSYRHDFKKSDEDLIESLPRLFVKTRNTKNGEIGKFSVLRKFSGSMNRDLNTALMTEPNSLFLLVGNDVVSKSEKEFREKYRAFLKKKHIETSIRMLTKNDYQGISGHIYVDMTDMELRTLSDIQIALDDENELSAVIYWPGNRQYVGMLGDQSVKMLQRPVYLSVEDSLVLHGVVNGTEGNVKQHALTPSECIILWKIYKSGLYEKAVKAVRKFDTENREWKINLKHGKKTFQYQIKLPKHFLGPTGLSEVLGDLEKKGLLKKTEVESVDDVEVLSISTCNAKLFKKLKKIMDYAVRTGYEESAHCFSVNTAASGETIIKDMGRFMDDEAGAGLLTTLTGVFDESDKKYLLRKYGDTVCYSSIAVHEALTDMLYLFKGIIYSECRREKVFDDLVTDLTLTGKKLKADLVGVKEGRIYLILIRDEPEVGMAVYYQYKEIVKNSSGCVIYILTRDIKIDIEDDGVRYIGPQDMDELCTDHIGHDSFAGKYMLCVAKKMRDIINARE